jgi:hypothetical protein
MSTRRAEDNSPLSQNRYMSSPEYAELRGISGTAIAPRAAILDDPALRSLLWFLQARSLEPGGLKQVAREVLEQNPDRIGTPSMHRFGMKPAQVYSAEQVRSIRKEMAREYPYPLRGEVYSYDLDDHGSYCPVRATDADREVEESKKHPTSYPAKVFVESVQRETGSLPGFLTDLCINPRLAFDRSAGREDYQQRLECEFPDQQLELKPVSLYWFEDIVGALLDYQRRHEEAVRADFVLTAIGRKVWETLDFALKSRRMVLVEGWEGRGKSEAAKAWCRMHRGESRFVDLRGVTSKTTVFRAIAKALGIASSYSRTATEMQARVEDVLERSRLMLVFDEAHFLFPQGARIYVRPELVDWIDTALCNHEVPVGLITTPQFIKCVKRAEIQVGWNWRQFRRRVRRWVQLPEWNADSDLEAVAAKVMPGLSRPGIKLAVGYAKMSLKGSPSRDVSGLGDVALEARLLAEQSGRRSITFEDVERAINEHLLPSDTCFAERMAAPEPAKRGRRCLPQAAIKEPLTASCSGGLGSSAEDDEQIVPSAASQGFSGGHRRADSLRIERDLVRA